MKTATIVTMLPALAVALPSVRRQECAATPAFILAGDSTTAPLNGWGDGFLSFLREGASGENLGHNGRTVPTFISGGDWDNVKQYVEDNVGANEVYVTIQVCSTTEWSYRRLIDNDHSLDTTTRSQRMAFRSTTTRPASRV